MLKILFGRYSRFVRSVEIVSLILSGVIIYHWLRMGIWRGFATVPDYLFALLICHYLFIRFCDFYHWYPGVASRNPDQPELGIEVHFLKALVPTSYILCLTAFLSLIGLAWPATILANLMMIVVSGVNVILIYFHVQDKDTLPVNYFTRELILSDASSIVQQCGHKKHVVQIKGIHTDERKAA